jgi:hypothetical protein
MRLEGVRVARDARALRVWMLSETDFPRFAVLHFLLPEQQRFEHVRLGEVGPGWRRLSVSLPRSLRGAELVGVEFAPVFVPLSSPPDLGYVELAGFEQLRPTGWAALSPIIDWQAAANGGSTEIVEFDDGAPVRRRLRLNVEGKALALVRPSLPLGRGVPALASHSVAAAAVDGIVTLDVSGKEIPVQVAGSARLFPTVIEAPSTFVVVDYETLFAALNVDQPGLALPNEAWFFHLQPSGLVERLGEPPFRLERLVDAEALKARLLHDPLAAGARDVFLLGALAAAVLALLGLVVAARSTLESERLALAEYEALGVPPRSLARSTQVRLLVLSVLGIVAGVAGALLAVRLVGAFVAVTGAGGRPLPPIEPVIAWQPGVFILIAVAAVALLNTTVLAARALREPAAKRLRA